MGLGPQAQKTDAAAGSLSTVYRLLAASRARSIELRNASVAACYLEA